MLPLGILLIGFGYAMVYTGISNWLNGFSGPRLSEALGLPASIRLGLPSTGTDSAGGTLEKRAKTGTKTSG